MKATAALGRYAETNERAQRKLELWISSQPAGQRVEDLLAWAHEIIRRYGPH